MRHRRAEKGTEGLKVACGQVTVVCETRSCAPADRPQTATTDAPLRPAAALCQHCQRHSEQAGAPTVEMMGRSPNCAAQPRPTAE